MKSLDIRFAFSVIDRLTRPVNAARQGAGGLSESLKKTQAAINDLDKQSKPLTACAIACKKPRARLTRRAVLWKG
ncbi:MAG: hypothetical protein ACMZI0_12395 [Symbiopectobacterium sp.]|uniref:hypothetical protein n=1 Tax=Symbiopectobacterium sp. TaxID=2952789 RepID=UPI0039E9CEF5